MSDMIYYKNGEETFRISHPTFETKCPETKLEVKKMNEIEKTEGEIKVLQAKLELLKEMENFKTPAEEAYKDAYGEYPMGEPFWIVFQKGYKAAQKDYKVGEFQPKEKEQKWDVVRGSVKWCKEHPDESVEDYLTPQKRGERVHKEVWNETEKLQEKNWYVDAKTLLKSNWEPKPQTPEQVDVRLRDSMRQAKKDGVFDEPTKPMNEVLDRLENKYKDAEENAASYMTDEVVNRMLKRWETDPPSFLRFELSKTLEALITRWWDDVLYGGIHQDWDREIAIDDLIDQIQLWLPREQSHEGTQSASVIDLVDGYDDALTKIKSKLRNKK
jgi:hypothetical protein